MRHHTAGMEHTPPIPARLTRFIREHPPQLTPEQQARKDANLEAHARLRPVYDESTRERLMRSNPMEVQREIDLMRQGGAPEEKMVIHRECLRELYAIRRAKYGAGNAVVEP